MKRAIQFVLTVAIFAALVAPTHAAPTAAERFKASVERYAPPYPTFPGKTRCVCQDVNDENKTFAGYLNSFPISGPGGGTMQVVCAYPIFAPGPAVAVCALFEVVK
ncbi:MAG TPA: hypothetical protein VFD92_24090 [Candidatus Binatia bacterium]|nr:hypothetical protein [Candidatus Binatia bacterium]